MLLSSLSQRGRIFACDYFLILSEHRDLTQLFTVIEQLMMQMEFNYYQTIIEDLFYDIIKSSLHCNNIKSPLLFKETGRPKI